VPGVEAVTFDYWDTLICAEPPPFKKARIEALVGVLAGAGHVVAPARVEEVLGAVFAEEFTPAWRSNRQYTAADAAASVVRRLALESATGSDGFGERVDAAVVEAFVAAGAEVRPQLTPGIADALAALVASGVRIGIICDVGLTPSTTLRRALEGHELLAHFAHWSFSDDVGVYKPEAAIFQHALDGLGGVDPARAAHVGDLRRTDVAGARAMGMTAIRYCGVADDQTEGPEGHHVLADHTALPGLIVG
jgi:FMN phosphatase YigB (HAD superfamily)